MARRGHGDCCARDVGRDLDAVVAEALELASIRGGAVSALTLAVPFPSAAVEARVRRQLARAGASAAEIVLEASSGPPRIVAVEIARTL